MAILGHCISKREQWVLVHQVSMFCSISLLAEDNNASRERPVPSNRQNQMSEHCPFCMHVQSPLMVLPNHNMLAVHLFFTFLLHFFLFYSHPHLSFSALSFLSVSILLSLHIIPTQTPKAFFGQKWWKINHLWRAAVCALLESSLIH